MKKIMAAIIGGTCIIGILSGCSNESPQSETRFNIVEYGESQCGTVSSFYTIWKDSKTSVLYVSFGNKGGSCVIVGEDGLPCTGNDEEG